MEVLEAPSGLSEAALPGGHIYPARAMDSTRKDPFKCCVIGPDSKAGTQLNEIVSNKKEQSELICCSGEFSVSQKAWPGLGIHHRGKSDSVLILNGP